ncbi:MAG: OmpH family outer membrane protein [Saprospiraceae bacterium]|nr:OmpH family outer membrane protein [Saprospiraceae bacterium]
MKKFLFVLLLATFAASASAQKYGHLNFGNLVALMPETKAADDELKKLQTDLVAKGEEMAKAFQERYVKALQDVQSGALSPLQQQQLQDTLETQRQAIAAYEQQITQELQSKREELLKPVIDKAEKAIDEIAKANGYVLIFDTSIFNAILFAQETDDIMPLLKAKLGLPDKPASTAEKKE